MASPSDILRPRASMLDYDRLQQEFESQKALQGAQIKKLMTPDVDSLGEQAFLKAAQGLELSPQELAAAQIVDAKSGGISFNPVTGTMLQKPRISDKIGLGGLGQQNEMQMSEQPQMGGFQMPAQPQAPMSELDRNYQTQIAAAAGNPKLQQELMATYAKSKLDFNEAEAKSAGFAERMKGSEAVIGTNAAEDAGTSLWNRAASSIPVLGNYMVSDEYQKMDQAKRDFVNAILRRESGAVISPEEFKNAEIQYFPRPGDSDATIRQKEMNRQTSLKGIERGAGAAYGNNPPPADARQRAIDELRRRGKI